MNALAFESVMNTDALTINGTWRRASSSADTDLEAQRITGTQAPFPLPAAPEPVRAAPAPTHTLRGITTDAIDDFLGVTRTYSTRQSRNDLHPSLGGSMPPLPYADADLPAYAAKPNTEPIMLARYFFQFGFLFPPLWMLGAIIWMCPLSAPERYAPSKSARDRERLVQIMRDAEVRWAKRCAWALVALVVLAVVALVVALALLHS